MNPLESFRSSSTGRQVAIVAVLAAVLCALLSAAYFSFLHKPYEVLFSNLRPMDAATIVAELDKKKVPYRLKDGGATILTPRDLVDGTRLNIMSEDLPIKGSVGFELFNKSDMGLTEFAQKINYQRALQGELARTIMTMDAVDSARIHLSIMEPTIFREDRRPSKASVTILTRPGKQLTDGAVRGIQRLVAAAVPDLDVANVVVLDSKGEVLSSDWSTPVSVTTVVGSQPVAPAISAPEAAPPPVAAWNGAGGTHKPAPGLPLISQLGFAVSVPLLLLLLWVAFGINRRTPLRRLSQQQREDYTRRLKALLDGREADAAPPV